MLGVLCYASVSATMQALGNLTYHKSLVIAGNLSPASKGRRKCHNHDDVTLLGRHYLSSNDHMYMIKSINF